MLAIAAATAPRTTPPETDAATARLQRRRCEHHDDEGPHRTEGPARRGNALVAAMMSALDGLMPGSATAAPRSEAVKDSATAFAHELFDALRSGGGHGRGFAWGHDHHRRHGGGYDGLAQRLDRLAAQVDAPATPVASTTTISASLSSASFSATVTGDGDDAAASLSSTVTTLQIDITQQTSAAAESPLQAAFRKLFEALQPAPAPGAAGAAPAASHSSLSDFLRQLAGALRNGSGTDEHTTAPATGGLLSLAA